MAESESRDNQVLKWILGTIGTLAGVTAAIYVFGGAVLYWRLLLSQVRTDAVVSSLPREFLISIGLAVLAQLVPFMILLLLVYVQEAELPLASGAKAKRIRVCLVLLATLVLAIPLLLRVWRDWPLVATTVCAAFATAVVLWLLLRWKVETPVRRSLDDKRFFFSERKYLLDAAVLLTLAGVVFVLWRGALEAASLDALGARVCANKQTDAITGLFVGANNERVYVGEHADPHRIAEIPRSEIKRVYLGTGAERTPCPVSLDSITLNPSKVEGGHTATATVALAGIAPDLETGSDEGLLLTLSSDDEAATVPPTVIVRKGASWISFPVTTKSVEADTTLTISASSNGLTKTAPLMVTSGS